MESSTTVRKPVLPVVVLLADRTCFTCQHWRGIEDGSVSWCDIYRQTIDSEKYEAQDCQVYEHCLDGIQPLLDSDPRED